MAEWFNDIADLLDRTFSLYTGGQTITAGGGVGVSPVLKVADVPTSIQSLTGDEKLTFGKDVIDGTHYFLCLTALNIKNGDMVQDDYGIWYRIVWWEYENVATGKYLAIIGKVMRQ